MRNEIAIVAGPRGWGDTRQSWLARVPGAIKAALGTTKETVPLRTVKALFYGEISDPEHHAARDVKRAAEIIAARNERRALLEKLAGLGGLDAVANPNLSSAEIALLEHVVRTRGGENRRG